MILFNDLPDEILEIIVGYIPHENLEDFLTNPIIGKFAFKELYSPVVIHNGTINLIKNYSYQHLILKYYQLVDL